MTTLDPAEVDRRLAGARIAIAHDYLTQRGGAERVVVALMHAFPQAEVHTLFHHPEGTYDDYAQRVVHTSPLNRVPLLRTDPRRALPLLALAAARMRIEADLVVASSSGWAHGFPTTGRQLVYCHSPARWLYLTDQYLGGGSRWKSALLTPLFAALRRWDQGAAHRGGRYLANSTVVRDRIAHVYGLRAEVVPPPHNAVLSHSTPEPVPALVDWADGYHLCVSRLQPYKNVDQVLAAFAGLPDQRLVVVGRGPLRDQLRAAAGSSVRMVEGLSDAQMAWTYSHATTLLAASHEDFGLTPIEAGAFGVPTLALRAGGYLDTIVEGLNGHFFDQPTGSAIRSAVSANLGRPWDADAIRTHVEQFSEATFIARIREQAALLLG